MKNYDEYNKCILKYTIEKITSNHRSYQLLLQKKKEYIKNKM